MSHMGVPGGSSVSWGCPDVPYGGARRVFHVLGATPCPIWGHMGGPPCPGDALMSHMGTLGGSSMSWGQHHIGTERGTWGVLHALGTFPHPIWGHMGGPPCLRDPLMSPRPIWGTRGVLHGLTPTSHWDNAELWGRADPRTSGPIGRQRPPAPNKLLADCFTFVTQKGDILGSIRSPPRRPAAPPPPFSLSAHAHP